MYCKLPSHKPYLVTQYRCVSPTATTYARHTPWYVYVPLKLPSVFVWFHISFFFSSRRRHTRFDCDWSSDVCSSDLFAALGRSSRGSGVGPPRGPGCAPHGHSYTDAFRAFFRELAASRCRSPGHLRSADRKSVV